MFYEEWLDKAWTAGLLKDGPQALIVNKSNIGQLLKALDIEEVV